MLFADVLITMHLVACNWALNQWGGGCIDIPSRVYSQGVFFTEAPAEFQHVNCMIVRIWEVKRVACYARAETFTEAVASVASMVATPLPILLAFLAPLVRTRTLLRNQCGINFNAIVYINIACYNCIIWSLFTVWMLVFKRLPAYKRCFFHFLAHYL